jgi:aspartate/methionine/tyrosine aminotransferase
MNPLAVELNDIIDHKSPVVFSLLSKRGKQIYFPKKGILAQAAEARGKAINATIGEAVEDDATPMRLDAIASKIGINPKQAFPYAPSFGIAPLRDKWKAMLAEKNPGLVGKDYSLPVVSSALTHGLSMAGYLFLDEGDTLLIPDISWDNYSLVFGNAYGAKLETFPLFKGKGLDLEGFRHALLAGDPQKKVVLLNFPNNPTGYSPTKEEAAGIIKILLEAAEKGHHIAAILDDAYFGLVYEKGIATESLFSGLCDIHTNVLAIKLDGPTKEDYVWGFRVGFMTYGIRLGTKELYGALEAKTAGAIRGNISNSSHLGQSLLLQAYEAPNYASEKQSKFNLLQSRYQAVKKTLADHPEYAEQFEPLPFNSGYFMCIQLTNNLDCEKVRQILLSEFDTGLINLSGVLRIAFSAVSASVIPTIFENIYKACKKA